MPSDLWPPEAGMIAADHAAARPNAVALYAADRVITFDALNRRANQLARTFADSGLKPGDGVALVCPNTPEFVECLLACLRSGLRLTPVSWRMGAGDIEYIVKHCDAKALVLHEACETGLDACRFDQVPLRLRIGGAKGDFASYENEVIARSDLPPASPCYGQLMLYTSGTTGRPKGVRKDKPLIYRRRHGAAPADDDVHLLCGPAYHSAPLYHDVILPMISGSSVVMMPKFDAEQALELIARYRVTRTHMVPTMFQKLLALPEEVRRRLAPTSLREVVHGGAPVSIATKQAMIAWVGPILREYFAATEGNGQIGISSEEWLRKPGSVGRITQGGGARVLDEAGNDCPAGVVGQVYFRNGGDRPRVSYHKDDDANARTFLADHFSVGDQGYVDADGYLFLTGRTADRIICGGVNIQPQEIDDVLMQHPSVRAACTVGTPNEEWGEEVKALIVAADASADRAALARDLIAFCRDRLAAYKAPRSIEFVAELPVSESGKVRRAELRARYWEGRARTI